MYQEPANSTGSQGKEQSIDANPEMTPILELLEILMWLLELYSMR